MNASHVKAAISIDVSIDDGRALLRCGRCGVEQVIWTRVDLTAEGVAALFTEEHLRCVPRPRDEDD